ncbi:putative metal-binding motif-containing protein [Stigmatella sp. ncwal1]|uniref:Metal-binding motif-containing protein n=1 Tax=Stigmatella ashevillensis TaxID=2995309 RepID=A0ABT5D206_9BACT|nr:putative metal-binding motif-containing protein [Stigmatella ashevillena]MDC0707699.1 putative metal-binding motif-containing protein [Stigmatella ashevillena]
MRLFLWVLLILTIAGCKGEERQAGAVRVDLSYATFRPGCLTLTVSDKADPSRFTVEELETAETPGGRPPRGRELTVAVFRQEGWSRDLIVTLDASEQGCAVENRRSVASQTQEAQVPEEGVVVVRLDLRATDLDDDGFVRTDEGGTDCDDANAAVKPGASNLACATAQGCEGTFSCTAEGVSTACVSPQTFTPWYKDVDGDGDGDASAPLISACTAPESGAVTTSGDCDDSSPFVFNGREELCDRLDNNCNGQTDEMCTPGAWREILPPDGSSSTIWRAVAVHAQGQAWVAGNAGKVVHVAGTSTKNYADCPGEWISAWARPIDGRVFLGSEQGGFATHALDGGGCGGHYTGNQERLNGLVGFGDGTATTLFAVSGAGRIFRWNYPADPVLVTQVNSALRAIHGTKVSNLLAVGTMNGTPQIFASNADGSQWREEALPAGLPSGLTLRSVHVVHDGLAFAAGDKGVVLMRARGFWSELPRLPVATTDTLSMVAYGRTALYVAANDETVKRLVNDAWTADYQGAWTPTAIGGLGPHEIWLVGFRNTVIRWGQ